VKPGQATVVLDDDPTGTQAVSGVPVVLEPTPDLLARACRSGNGFLHVLTNSRALAPEAARETVRLTAELAILSIDDPLVVLRGDSTLRAHLREEWEGVRDALFPGALPPLLLVPALPSAGRITIEGVQYVTDVSARTPVHESPYARDPVFGFSHSYLPDWAAERSCGYFAAADARVVSLSVLRKEGSAAVVSALAELAARRHAAVCAVDAQTESDVALAAAGLRQAHASGIPVIGRGSPAFSAALAGPDAAVRRVLPRSGSGRSVLIVCGSHVPRSTRQLAELNRRHPGTCIELDLHRALGQERDAEQVRVVTASLPLLERGLAIVATPREFERAAESSEAGAEVAAMLARVVRELASRTTFVVAKGGITSAVVARDGLGATLAEVVGELVPGVSMWDLESAETKPPIAVFPGNVGEDAALADLVDLVRGA
jgi:uncharacterized protein YgbK (DUF1537 family)